MHFSVEETKQASIRYFSGNELAANSFVKKYALRNKDGDLLEKTPDDMHRRLAAEFHRIDRKFAAKNSDAKVYSEEDYFHSMENFARIVPQGSPMAAIGNKYSNISASNCFVIDAERYGDSISGLLHVISEVAEIMKRRGGVGVDVSVYRPVGSTVNNAAVSSTGVPSICDAISYFGRYIGQAGRQGALMITLSDRHPDIVRFAKMKADLTKVTGANVSVRISNDLVDAVENDDDWELRWPVEGEPKVRRTVKAREIWDEITEQAWKTGEPGVLMWDNYIDNLPAHCYKDYGFKTLTTNPCSEIALSGYDSCRLISLNLVGYVDNPHTAKAEFNFGRFKSDVRKATQMADNLVEIEIEIIDRILNNLENDEDENKLPYSVQKNLWTQIKEAAEKGRRTGLGTHGLYDCFAALGVPFNESTKLAEEVFKTFRNSAYNKSVDLAVDRGAFPVFNWEIECNNDFIKRLPDSLKNKIKECGRRNISLLTQAPTGTTSLISKTSGNYFGVSSGMEPMYSYAYIRKVKITSDQEMEVHSVDQNGDKWHHYPVVHGELLSWADKNGHDPASILHAVLENSKKESPLADIEVIDNVVGGLPKQWRVTAQNLSTVDRLDIVSRIQKYVDHGISQTCNFPKGTPKEVVDNFYREACHLGLKGVTVYVDGSRTGVLVSKESKKIVDRPDDVECDIHRENGSGLVLVGKIDGQIYEVFAGNREDLPVPSKLNKAKIRKLGSRDYALVYPKKTTSGKEYEAVIPISESFLKDEGMTVRLLTNLAIRNNVNLEDVVSTIFKSADMSAFSRRVARVLSNYIVDAEKHEGCCDSPQIRYEDGCKHCDNCGWSRCN